MKILFLNHNIHGRGGYPRCLNLARHIAAKNHDVTLITLSDRLPFRAHEHYEYGVRIIEAPSALCGHYQGGAWGMLDILWRIGFVSRKRFDLVYAFDHKPNVSFPALIQKYIKRVPVIFDWADWWCRGGHLAYAKNFPLQMGIETFLEERTKRIGSGVTVISRGLLERARSLGIPGDRILYLPSGADIETIRPLEKKAARAGHNLPVNGKIIGYISANLIDVDMLLKSMVKVFSERRDCLLLFMGPDQGHHREFARSLNIDERIIWTGFQPYERIAGFIACADIMALPMRDNLINKGRWPNRIGEHMAAGKATVACAVGDMADLFASENIGILAQPTETDFSEKTLRLLDHAEEAASLGAEARHIAETKYSWPILTERFLRFLAGISEINLI